MLGFRIKPQLNTSITQLAYKWINNYEIYGSNSLTPIVIKKKKNPQNFNFNCLGKMQKPHLR